MRSRCIGKSGSDSSGIFELSATTVPWSEAENRVRWFRVWARPLKMSRTTWDVVPDYLDAALTGRPKSPAQWVINPRRNPRRQRSAVALAGERRGCHTRHGDVRTQLRPAPLHVLPRRDEQSLDVCVYEPRRRSRPGRDAKLACTFMEISPWMAVFPGLAIMIVVLGSNFLGDGPRDFLDLRLWTS